MIETITKVATCLSVSDEEAEMIVCKAVTGGETNEEGLHEWFENRFVPNTVFINEEGYASMCIDALKILGTTSASDYGSSRQRDFGQIWADMTRGYLGELALKIFLKEKYNLDVELGHEVGELADFLPSDIHFIRDLKGHLREPKINVGIKAAKWNGIWLDIPGDQFEHSDVHVFIKVGVSRDHLFAYFKKISVFKDKILTVGKNIGLLTEGEADNLYDRLPTFRPIPAYVCGFVLKNHVYRERDYEGKKGRLNFTITGWNGPINAGDVEKIKIQENVSGKIKFESIEKFSHDKGYLFNAGHLIWDKSSWQNMIDKM